MRVWWWWSSLRWWWGWRCSPVVPAQLPLSQFLPPSSSSSPSVPPPPTPVPHPPARSPTHRTSTNYIYPHHRLLSFSFPSVPLMQISLTGMTPQSRRKKKERTASVQAHRQGHIPLLRCERACAPTASSPPHKRGWGPEIPSNHGHCTPLCVYVCCSILHKTIPHSPLLTYQTQLTSD